MERMREDKIAGDDAEVCESERRLTGKESRTD